MLRYRFEFVRDALDDFVVALNPAKHAPFLRAVQLLYRVVGCHADAEYASYTDDPEQRLAWAWEDVHMAFLGLGEPVLMGATDQLWEALRDHDRVAKRYRRMLKRALRTAERRTHVDAPRRYPAQVRAQSPYLVHPEGLMPPELPAWGPQLEAHAAARGDDPELTSDMKMWMEERERARIARLLPGLWRGHLRVLEGRGADAAAPAAPAGAARRPEVTR